MAGDQWFYTRSGQQNGPVSESDLASMASTGSLGPQDLLWQDGMAGWVAASTVPGLFAAAPAGAYAAPLAYSGPVPVGYYTPPNASVRYAGFWMRFCASFIDGILTGIVSNVLGYMVGFGLGLMMARSGSTQADMETAAGLLGGILGLTISWLYEAFMESSTRQATLGKMAMGIKVTDLQGERISFGRASGRYFGKFLSYVTFLIGFIMAGFTERKQALHDIMAGTLVTRK